MATSAGSTTSGLIRTRRNSPPPVDRHLHLAAAGRADDLALRRLLLGAHELLGAVEQRRQVEPARFDRLASSSRSIRGGRSRVGSGRVGSGRRRAMAGPSPYSTTCEPGNACMMRSVTVATTSVASAAVEVVQVDVRRRRQSDRRPIVRSAADVATDTPATGGRRQARRVAVAEPSTRPGARRRPVDARRRSARPGPQRRSPKGAAPLGRSAPAASSTTRRSGTGRPKWRASAASTSGRRSSQRSRWMAFGRP